jgi:hypothetical protein
MDDYLKISRLGCEVPKDVYADDLAQAFRSPQERTGFVFRIEADADADVFQRIVNPLILANRAPLCATLVRRQSEDDTIVRLDVHLEPIALTVVQSIARKLEQLTCVRHVVYQELDQSE